MTFVLWPVLAVWMGLALVIGVGILAVIAWCVGHLAHDVVVGDDGAIWCPVHQRQMSVHGTPRGSASGAPFVALWRCEQYADHKVGCRKTCLGNRSLVSAAIR